MNCPRFGRWQTLIAEMAIIGDMDLVREYARHKSEESFATLVSRHINMVLQAQF